jgi:hypothetical protein
MNSHHYFNYDLIFFDCDSTLSTIEGIDELAKLAGKEAESPNSPTWQWRARLI